MAGLEYRTLYALQDRVMETLFSVEKEFYLTGGTCLHRFYIQDRYSDDLDFFANQSVRFPYALKNIKESFHKEFEYKVVVETKNFQRMMVEDVLQVDFVNDVQFREGEPLITPKGYVLDTVGNILSNKISALMGRDEPKDVFDIYRIWKTTSYSWQDVLESVHKKAVFSEDELIVRLKTFPVELMKKLKGIRDGIIPEFQTDLPVLLNEIVEKKEHAAQESLQLPGGGG